MAQGFGADVLLSSVWSPDLPELSDILAEHFPALGPVVPATDAAGAPALQVDGAVVPITLVLGRHPLADAGLAEEAAPRLVPIRAFDPAEAVAIHRAHLRVECTGPGRGIHWSRAYATVVTAVAGCLARIGPCCCVVYPSSGAVLTPQDAFRAGRMALGGVSPIEAWVSFIPYRPANLTVPVTEAEATPHLHGAMTQGLAAFAGREIEIAPEPREADRAVQRAQGLVWQVLDAGLDPADGQRMADPATEMQETVRLVPHWLRPGVPAFVVVGVRAPVDPVALTALVPPQGPRLTLPAGLSPASVRVRCARLWTDFRAGVETMRPVLARAMGSAAAWAWIHIVPSRAAIAQAASGARARLAPLLRTIRVEAGRRLAALRRPREEKSPAPNL